jgi:hypothetical protein
LERKRQDLEGGENSAERKLQVRAVLLLHVAHDQVSKGLREEGRGQ